MELTQEHFDRQLEELNKRLDNMATKADLQAQTKELEAYTNSVAATILEAVDTGFNKINTRLDDRDKKFEAVEEDIKQLKGAMHLS